MPYKRTLFVHPHSITYLLLSYFLYLHVRTLFDSYDTIRVGLQRHFRPPPHEPIAMTACIEFPSLEARCPWYKASVPATIHQHFVQAQRCGFFKSLRLIQFNESIPTLMSPSIVRHHFSHLSFGMFCETFKFEAFHLFNESIGIYFQEIALINEKPVSIYFHHFSLAPEHPNDLVVYFTKRHIHKVFLLTVRQIEFDPNFRKCRSYSIDQTRRCQQQVCIKTPFFHSIKSRSFYKTTDRLRNKTCLISFKSNFGTKLYDLFPVQSDNAAATNKSDCMQRIDLNCDMNCLLISCSHRLYSGSFTKNGNFRMATIKLLSSERFLLQRTFTISLAFTLLSNSISVLFGLSMIDLLPALLQPMLIVWLAITRSSSWSILSSARRRREWSQWVVRFIVSLLCTLFCTLHIYNLWVDNLSHRSEMIIEIESQHVVPQLSISICFLISSIIRYPEQVCTGKSKSCYESLEFFKNRTIDLINQQTKDVDDLIGKIDINERAVSVHNSSSIAIRTFYFQLKKCFRIDVRPDRSLLDHRPLHRSLNKHVILIQVLMPHSGYFVNDYGQYPSEKSPQFRNLVSLALIETWTDCARVDCFDSHFKLKRMFVDSFDCLERCRQEVVVAKQSRIPSCVPYELNRHHHLEFKKQAYLHRLPATFHCELHKAAYPFKFEFDLTMNLLNYNYKLIKTCLTECERACGQPLIVRQFVELEQSAMAEYQPNYLELSLLMPKTVYRPRLLAAHIQFSVNVFGIVSLWFGLNFMSIRSIFKWTKKAKSMICLSTRTRQIRRFQNQVTSIPKGRAITNHRTLTSAKFDTVKLANVCVYFAAFTGLMYQSNEYWQSIGTETTEQIMLPSKWWEMPSISICYESNMKLNTKSGHPHNRVNFQQFKRNVMLTYVAIRNDKQWKSWLLKDMIRQRNQSEFEFIFFYLNFYCVQVPLSQYLQVSLIDANTPFTIIRMRDNLSKRLIFHLPDQFPISTRLEMRSTFELEVVIQTEYTMPANGQFYNCEPKQRPKDDNLMQFLLSEMNRTNRWYSFVPLPYLSAKSKFKGHFRSREFEKELSSKYAVVSSTSSVAARAVTDCVTDFTVQVVNSQCKFASGFQVKFRNHFWHLFNLKTPAPDWVEITLNLGCLAAFWIGFCLLHLGQNVQNRLNIFL